MGQAMIPKRQSNIMSLLKDSSPAGKLHSLRFIGNAAVAFIGQDSGQLVDVYSRNKLDTAYHESDKKKANYLKNG